MIINNIDYPIQVKIVKKSFIALAVWLGDVEIGNIIGCEVGNPIMHIVDVQSREAFGQFVELSNEQKVAVMGMWKAAIPTSQKSYPGMAADNREFRADQYC